MKTLATVIFSVVATAMLVPRPAGQAASPSGSPAAPGYSQYINTVPRFQIVTVHPSGVSEDSVLLDTTTGCTWAFAVFKDRDEDWDFRPFDADLANPASAGSEEQSACDAVLFHAIAMQRQAAPSK